MSDLRERAMGRAREKIRLGVIGSGAIAEMRYLPAARLCPTLSVTHLIDLDSERVRRVADSFEVPHALCDYREIFGSVDAVIVATPPDSHAGISIDCLNHGLHVLCEKPLATRIEDAKAMISASGETHRRLAIGMVRRLSWSARLLKEWIGAGFLGKVEKFEAEEGWEFCWPLRTGHVFQSGKSGGVIRDTGTHLLDLMVWVLGGRSAEIISCMDDSRGGVEANAIVELTIHRSSGAVHGLLELSFTRNLRNRIRIHGERGYFETSPEGSDQVCYYPEGRNSAVVLKPDDKKPRDVLDEFASQLSYFSDAICGASENLVSAEEALLTMELVEACCRVRKAVVHPWEAKHLGVSSGGFAYVG